MFFIICKLLSFSITSFHIFYFVLGFQFIAEVLKKHQRTVQLIGLPQKKCTFAEINRFCQEREIDCQKVHVAPAASASRAPRVLNGGESGLVEIIFHSAEEMEEAFTSKRLKPIEAIFDTSVRARPKAGTYSASVDYWVMMLLYFSKEVPLDYWCHTIISSLITLSLIDSVFIEWFWQAANATWRSLGGYGRSVSFFCAGLSLGSVVFLGFYQAYWNLKHMRQTGILRKSRSSSENLFMKAE